MTVMSDELEAFFETIGHPVTHVGPDVLIEVADFNWLWPAFEHLCCDKNASPKSLDEFVKQLNFCNDTTDAWNYFRQRYVTDSEAKYRMKFLCPNKQSEKMAQEILDGLDSNASPQTNFVLSLTQYTDTEIIYSMALKVQRGWKTNSRISSMLTNFFASGFPSAPDPGWVRKRPVVLEARLWRDGEGRALSDACIARVRLRARRLKYAAFSLE